jgi:small subunit ribosomal protein S27Ae
MAEKEKKKKMKKTYVKKSFCPKCGEGVRLAEHKDRFHCGKCGYTRWK